MRKIFFFLAAIVSLNLMATEGALNGKFTINASGDQIVFSKGNLQYVGTWQFATNQWDCIGDSQQADDNRDLFGWGTGDAPNKVSDNCEDYATFHEWGANPITNGGNAANLWRTLTSDEWRYLFVTRNKATELFGVGKIGNIVYGAILLPDDWTLPEGASFASASAKGYAFSTTSCDGYYSGCTGTDNEYTIEQWAVMEEAGAVFLPAAGYRGVYGPNVVGDYWSATAIDEWFAYAFLINTPNIFPTVCDLDKYNGVSVRLVQAAPIETAIETPSLQGRSGEAHKRLVNGQLLIEKNEKIYNAQGVELR